MKRRGMDSEGARCSCVCCCVCAAHNAMALIMDSAGEREREGGEKEAPSSSHLCFVSPFFLFLRSFLFSFFSLFASRSSLRPALPRCPSSTTRYDISGSERAHSLAARFAVVEPAGQLAKQRPCFLVTPGLACAPFSWNRR